MKTRILLILSLFIGTQSFAQDQSQYENYLRETIALYDSVKTLDDYQNIANRFDRMAAAEQGEWLPQYYAGLTRIWMSFVRGLEDDQRDEYIELALEHIEKAEELEGESSEIVTLKGYAYMAKVSVNPGIRGMMLSAKVSGLFEKAVKTDPSNPRANLMYGRWKYGSAQFFGSSTETACSYMSKALALYQAEAESNTILPHWGQNQAEQMTKRCSGNK